jgi:hypothetical protein
MYEFGGMNHVQSIPLVFIPSVTTGHGHTLANSEVLPPSTGPTSKAVAGPPRLVVLLAPVVTIISTCFRSKIVTHRIR